MRLLKRVSGLFGSFVALTVGLIVLLGLTASDNLDLLSDLVQILYFPELAIIFLRIATVTIAVTIFIGVLNLLGVHVRRLVQRRGGRLGWLNSLILLVSFMAAIVLYLLRHEYSMILLEDVQIAIESAIAALLFFTLVHGAYRLTHEQLTIWKILFIISVLVVLLGALALPGFEIFAQLRDLWISIPVSAGARGLLLGIAIATIVTAVRAILGQDRSYRE